MPARAFLFPRRSRALHFVSLVRATSLPNQARYAPIGDAHAPAALARCCPSQVSVLASLRADMGGESGGSAPYAGERA